MWPARRAIPPIAPERSTVAPAANRCLAPADAVRIAERLCYGIEYAHSLGIVHRDIKPANVFLANDGTPLLGDFGLAVAPDQSRITSHGMMVGTAAYLPPEQALGHT